MECGGLPCIQENKQNIQLSDKSIFNLLTIWNYNIEANEVTKKYEFIEKNGSILDNGVYGVYKRFICCLDELKKIINEYGNFNIEINGVWLLISRTIYENTKDP